VTTGYLLLEDGSVFRGRSVGADGSAFGEAVFTTAMTGYQETVTDPSYAAQLVCFTAPMVGNYGVAAGRAESTGAHAKAVLMREARGPEWTVTESGFRSRSANSWLLGKTLRGKVLKTVADGRLVHG
jgi:carbamoylphosphate synthase small subunit